MREAFTANRYAKAPSPRGLAQRSCDWGSICSRPFLYFYQIFYGVISVSNIIFLQEGQ